MRSSLGLFVCIAVLIAPAIGRAQEKTVAMEEIVVTATKTEEKRQDIPNPVILMNRADIEESPANSLGDLLGNELGIDWRTYGNYGGAAETIKIRGFSANGTQVFVNGISYNSPSLGTADVGQIALNSIDRIEVVKGSGSLLYGTGAMGGTINIITKRPQRDKIDLKASAGYGIEDAYHLSAEHGMYAFGDFGYYLTANRRETDGFRNNADLVHNDVSLNLILDKGDALEVQLYGDIVDREYGVPGPQPPAGTVPYQNSGQWLYDGESADLLDQGEDQDQHLVLNVKGAPLDWLGYSLKGDYSHMKNYFYNRYNLGATIPGTKTWTTNEVQGVEGNLNFKPLDSASLLVGGEYKDYDWENESNSLDTFGRDVAGTSATVTEKITTKGAYAEAQYRPFDLAKFLLGIRHENHSTFGHADLPRYGLVVNPLDKTVVKFSHGKHYNAPTPNDLFYPDDGFVAGNPDLVPEDGWHSDISLEQALFQDKVFLSLTYFQWDLDNKIQWEPDSNGKFMPENLREYNAKGVEVGTKIGPWENMLLALNYTYTDAEEENRAYTKQQYPFLPWVPADFQYTWVKRRASNTPRDQFKGSLTWWSAFDLTAMATVRYVGDRVWYRTESTGYPNTETVEYNMAAYWTVDLKLEQRLWQHWLVTLQGNNLFDEEYDTYLTNFSNDATGANPTVGYPGAGSSFYASVAYEF